MEYKLNIFSNERDEKGNKKIVKTYESSDYKLMYGVVEDILDLFDENNFKSTDPDEQLFDLITNAREQVNNLLKDIFYGLSDEELKLTDIEEIADVLLGVLKGSINKIVGKAKNALRG